MVHTQPTPGKATGFPGKPTNAVGGWFILSLHRGRRPAFRAIPPTQLVGGSYSAYTGEGDRLSGQAHQRSWWMVHTQPTPGKATGFPGNPTNAVGGWFILSLPREGDRLSGQSHQRSWWDLGDRKSVV